MTRPLGEMAATTGDEPEPSPRSEWQTVITLAVAMIVAAFVLGYVWGKVAG